MTVAGYYVYCVADGPKGPLLRMAGLQGKEVRQVPHGDIRALCSELADGTGFTEGDVLVHEALVESAMAQSAVLPMRFGTVFPSRGALLGMLESFYPRFRAALDRVAGKVEVGVKVLWEAEALKNQIAARPPSAGKWSEKESGRSPGRTYLLRRFQEYLLERGLEAKAVEVASSIDTPLRKWASEARVETLCTENLVLAASYLVHKGKLDAFKAEFDRLKAGHPGLKFLYSGPWPPYNFVGSFETGEGGAMTRSSDLAIAEREALWRRGERCLEEGAVHTALDVFWKILEKYPDSMEGERAKEEVLNLAKSLEAQGQPHQALDLYSRLADRA